MNRASDWFWERFFDHFELEKISLGGINFNSSESYAYKSAGAGGVVPASMGGFNTSELLLGFGLTNNILSKSASLSIADCGKGLYTMTRSNQATLGLLKGVAKTTKYLGWAGMGASVFIDSYQIYKDPSSWGNYGRLGVTGLSIGISLLAPGVGTLLGLGINYLDYAGHLNYFYNDLDKIGNLNTSKLNQYLILGLYLNRYPIKFQE